MMNNNAITLSLIALALAAVTGMIQVQTPTQAQNTTVEGTTTRTATQPAHFFHHGYLQWRAGHSNPFGIFQGSNIVSIPSGALQPYVNNQCPYYAPVLLSTGTCITQQQALQLAQSGQIQTNGQISAYGNVIVGTPTVLGIHGYHDLHSFFGFHHIHIR